MEIDEEMEKQKALEGRSPSPSSDEGNDDNGGMDNDDNDKFSGSKNRYMFFTEIAKEVAPMIDALFPEESGVRIIAEPGEPPSIDRSRAPSENLPNRDC